MFKPTEKICCLYSLDRICISRTPEKGGGSYNPSLKQRPPASSSHPAAYVSLYLKEPLETPLLDCLAGEDVGKLRVGVRDEEAGGHVLLDELRDPHFGAGADRGVRGRAVRLSGVCTKRKGRHTAQVSWHLATQTGMSPTP